MDGVESSGNCGEAIHSLLHKNINGFVIKKSVFYKCLELYPKAEWEKEMAGIDKLNRFVKKNNDFIRAFTAGVKMVEIDATGRLLIPKDLVLLC